MDIFQIVPVAVSAEIFMVENITTCIHDKATVSANKEHKSVVGSGILRNSVLHNSES